MKWAFDWRLIVAILAFCAVFYGSVLLVELTIPFLQFKPNIDFLASKRLIYHLDWWRISFYTHVFSSPFVIFSGLFQFNRFIIHRLPKLHRFLGFIYIFVLIFIAAPSGFLMGLYANGSYPTQISFSVLSILWVFTTIMAYKKVKEKDYVQHGNWMIRSYALTLSAISLRFFTFLIGYFKLPIYPADAYILVAYSSWIVNLIVAELLIRLRYANYLMNAKSLRR
jgi:uncharacterized membrane protein